MFKALVLNQQDKITSSSLEILDESSLPEGDTLIQVNHSSINYKDGLAITGKGKIIRDFPMVPGIDFVGEVLETSSTELTIGQQVVLTGWGVGENHWGGMAEKARVDARCLVPLPEKLSPEQSMMIGTAGFTAMLCVQALLDGGLTPESGTVLVTGASGGVGSVAVTLLSELGFTVAAASGRAEENADFLKALGASDLVERSALEEPAKPLEKQLWAGVVDTVGSKVLAKALSQTNYDGVVAACGLAGGFDLPTTVMPFILRNVRLQGIDSVMCPKKKRLAAWDSIADLLPAKFYQSASTTISLDQVPEFAERITLGQTRGRVIVAL
jgi:acrylyl-CoA reductase (NADPH)